jgi:hypothetical protein
MARKAKTKHSVQAEGATLHLLKDEKRYSISGWDLSESQIDSARQAGHKLAQKLDNSSRGGSTSKDTLSAEQRDVLDAIVDICLSKSPGTYQREARRMWEEHFFPRLAATLSRDQLRASKARVLTCNK